MDCLNSESRVFICKNQLKCTYSLLIYIKITYEININFLLWWIMYIPLKVLFDLVVQTQKRGNWKTRQKIFIQNEMCCDNYSPELNLSLWHHYHFTENWQYREQRQWNPPSWLGSNLMAALTCMEVPAWALNTCWQHSWLLYL